MSGSDSRIAPVTYLFGAAPFGAAAGAEAPAAPRPQPDEGWYVGGEPATSEPEPEPEPTEPAPEPSAMTEPVARPEWQGAGSRVEAARLALARAEDEARVKAEQREREAEPVTSKRVKNVSIDALARRGMSSAEMTRLLESRELEPDDVSAEVDRLEGVGLLDDHALAENLVRTLQQRKGLGRSAITAELRRRKLDDGAISEAVEQIEGDDELARACEIALKRAPQLRNLDGETAKRRLGAFLMRRGYAGGIVSTAVDQALGSSGPRFR